MAQSAPASGRLRGQVTDSLGVAIPHASVLLLGTDLSATTDADGLFRFSVLGARHYSVLVRAIGWKPLMFDLTIQPAEEWVGRIGLEPSPLQLPELSVTGRSAKPLRYANTTRFDGFYSRRGMGLGHYFTRDQVDAAIASGAQGFGNLLERMAVPGVRFGPGAQPSDVYTFDRCRKEQGEVGVWIDGARVPNHGAFFPVIELGARDIEAIEVYRGLAAIPGEFNDAGSCAVIVIWTRYN
jgi:hypothetical protein